MRFKHSLQFRIFLSYAIFGITIGALLFLFLLISYNQLEDQLISNHLEDEMEFFIASVEQNPNLNTIKTKRITGYRVKLSEQPQGYPFLRNLGIGTYDIIYNNRDYAVNVVKLNNFVYYIIYDITYFEQQEHHLTLIFSISILLTVFGAIWYGYILGGRVLAPVKHLAKILKKKSVEDLHIRLAPEFANDEVGSLAKSFDVFIERIQTFVLRERHFVSDASHELRTPIAIIQSTTEVLLSTAHLTGKNKERLLRIQRAVKNVTLSISALLMLAREPIENEKHEGGISVADIVSDIIDSSRESMDQTNASIELNILAEPEIVAPDSVISLLINNLIINAIRYTPKGKISVVLDETSLKITDTGIGIPSADIGKIFHRGYRAKNVSGDGSGLGLSLVKRFCDHFGWEIDVSGEINKGSIVTWRFSR